MTTKRGSSGRDLDPRHALDAGDGVTDAHDQVERQVRDVGEGVPGVDRQRGEHGEDLAAEDVGQVLAVGVVERGPVRHPHPGLGQGRARPSRGRCATAGRRARSPARRWRAVPRWAAGRRPTGCAGPASTWSFSPATRTWKNSSRPSEKMARNFTRSSSGTRSSSARSRSRAPNSSHDSSRLEKRSGPRTVTASSTPTGESVVVASPTDGPGAAAALAPTRRFGGLHQTSRVPPVAAPDRAPDAGVRRRPGSRLDPVPRLLSRLAPTEGMRVRRPKPKTADRARAAHLRLAHRGGHLRARLGGHDVEDPRQPGAVPGRRARARPGRPHRQPHLRPRRQRRAPPHRHPAQRARAT